MTSSRTLARSRASRPAPAAAHRLLLVDNDPVIRETVALLLSRTGYRVACATDGEAGWAALCAERFDLLITDHEMPKLTGLDLLRRLRAGPLPLPTIMISGFIPWDEPDLKSLLRPGAAIEKPFSFAVLLAHVRELLPTGMAGSATVSADHWPVPGRSDMNPSV